MLLVVYSDKTRNGLQCDVHTGRLIAATNPARGTTFGANLMQKTNEGRNALVNTMGVDMRVDENGNYWLISCSCGAVSIANNTKARQIAADSAYARALGGCEALWQKRRLQTRWRSLMRVLISLRAGAMTSSSRTMRALSSQSQNDEHQRCGARWYLWPDPSDNWQRACWRLCEMEFGLYGGKKTI